MLEVYVGPFSSCMIPTSVTIGTNEVSQKYDYDINLKQCVTFHSARQVFIPILAIDNQQSVNYQSISAKTQLPCVTIGV